jgi:hypothetical protein
VGRFQIVRLLTVDAQSYAWNGLSTRLRNGRIALLAVLQTFAARQPGAGTGDGIIDAGIDLILHCTIAAPASGHTHLVSTRSVAYFKSSRPTLRAGITRA